METINLALDLALLSDKSHERYSILAFALATSFYGILVVTLDFCIVKVTNKSSWLKLSYSGFAGIFVLLIWGIGAGIAGLIGAATDIFEINRHASVVVGAGWAIIVPKLLSNQIQELSKEKISLE